MSGDAALRDELTQAALASAGARLRDVQVVGFTADWWDGQAHAPCLIVRGGRRGRRQRVVETAGECVILPFARRRAQQWLADRRRPRRVELMAAPAASPRNVVLDADPFDVVRCRSDRCGALLLVGYDGDCPLCGAG